MIRIFADSSGREPEVGIGGKTSIFNPARAEFIGLERRHEALSYLFTIFDQLQSVPGARRGRDRFVFIESTYCPCPAFHEFAVIPCLYA